MAQENLKIKEEATKVEKEEKVNVDPELDVPYVDTKTIIISLVNNYSYYRRVNRASLKEHKEVIGSSISSCRTLAANKGEIETYFPTLIGLTPSNPDFITRVKAWLSNIQFIVKESDATLDVSFRYNTKRDYLKIKAKEEAIDEEYSKVNRTNLKDIKDAVARKVKALNELEGTKYLYGYPINLQEYLIYRHCLLYKDVAKDTALINADPTLRFYIKDEAKELEKQRKFTENRKKAMTKFIELDASPSAMNAVYIAISLANGTNLSDALNKTNTEKSTIVMNYVNENPDKFIKFVEDKTLGLRAFIETLIMRGELIRSEFNQQISTADGTFIGSNMNEAVAYFNNPNNASVKTMYENKLKQL